MSADELKGRWRSWLRRYETASVGTRAALAALVREEGEAAGGDLVHYAAGVADLLLPEE